MALAQTTNLLDSLMKTGPGGPQAADTDQTQLAQAVNKQQGQSAQQLGATMASSAGQAQLQRTQGVIQEKTGLQQQGLQRQTMGAEANQSNREIAYQNLAEKNNQRLFSLGQDVGNQISNTNRQFALDEEGRKYMNQQMLDQYAVHKMQNSEQLKDYTAQVTQNYTRKAQLMDTMSAQIKQALNQGFVKQQGDLDKQSQVALANIANYYDQKKEDALKQAQSGQLLQQLGTGILTAVATYGAYALMA